MEYYVYQLIDPRSNKPFYIGEGKGKRAWSHLTFNSGCNNPHKDRVIRKIQKLGLEVGVEIIKDSLTKEESKLLESRIIDEIGLDNLTNICKDANPPILYGKDNGFYGKTHGDRAKILCGNSNRGKDTKTKSGKQAISDAMKLRWMDPVARENQINALRSRKGEKRSPDAIASYKEAASKRNANMTQEERSARTIAGNETKKIKYAGLKKQAYIDDQGKKRFKWVPA